MNDEIKRILDDIDNEECYYIGNQGCEYQDLDKRELKLIKDYITNLQQENGELKEYLKIMEKGKDNNLNRFLNYKSRIEKATKDLFELKDMIYKPETRDENIPIQQKISSIIKQLNGRSDE